MYILEMLALRLSTFKLHTKMMRILVSILVLFPYFLTAQNGVGEWIDYFPYRKMIHIVDAGDKVFAASPYSLLEIDKKEKSMTRLSKINGLSETNINHINYHKPTKTLFVAYESGAFDLIKENRIQTINDIKNANIMADKKIYRVNYSGDTAFISCGFGLVLYNMKRREVIETAIVGNQGLFVPVTDAILFKDTIWCVTEQGIKHANSKDPLLSFFGVWKTDSNFIARSGNIKKFSIVSNRLTAIYGINDFSEDTIYYKQDTSWIEWDIIKEKRIRSFKQYQDKIYAAVDGEVKVFDLLGNETFSIFNYLTGVFPDPRNVLLDNGGTIWIADENQGVISSEAEYLYDYYLPDAPYTENIEDIDIRNSKIIVSSGGKNTSYDNVFLADGVMVKDKNKKWTVLNRINDSKLDPIRDYIRVAIDPKDPSRFFVGTLGVGLLEFKEDKFYIKYDTSNSTLSTRLSSSWIGIAGMQFDNEGNLWMINSRAEKPLHVLDNEGKWHSFSTGEFFGYENIADLMIDNNGYKWFYEWSKGQGVMVYDDGGTLDDPSDDKFRLLNGAAGNGGLHSTTIRSLACDKKGEVWVGTDQGIAIFYNTQNIFNGNAVDAQRPLIEENRVFQYLLESEQVNWIEVDPANRKWIATENSGAFLLSEDGTKELLKFNTSNSSLISNKIKMIKVHPQTGEVFFATDKGLVAYKGTATESDALFSNVLAYPNPVHPDYNGLIAIKGLANASQVKITDVSGNLVFETYAEGGQAVWNGKRMSGEALAAGVYLVFASDDQGQEREVTKIMLIR